MLTLSNERSAYERYIKLLGKAKGQPITPELAKSIATSSLGGKTGEGISLSSPKIDWNEVASEMTTDQEEHGL
jgi:hypothetical protein